MPSKTLRIGQSADPDDAFMAWGLQRELEVSGYRSELVFDDIESLNRLAIAGDLDLAAISVGAYPTLASRYRLLRCGASFGDAYGPLVVATEAPRVPGAEALRGLRIATPGAHTTARMLLRIYGGESYEELDTPFDRIMDVVLAGEVDAGLIIHEGQLVFAEYGLHAVFEPAERWDREEGLPLPLGAVAVSRSLDLATQQALAAAFGRSVHAAFKHLDEALDFAAGYARGLSRELLAEYVNRYVNAVTLDMGDAGIAGIERLFEKAADAGLLAAPPTVDPI